MTITMGRQMGFGNQQVIDGGSCEEVSIHADYVMSMETMCSIYPQMAIFQGFWKLFGYFYDEILCIEEMQKLFTENKLSI